MMSKRVHGVVTGKSVRKVTLLIGVYPLGGLGGFYNKHGLHKIAVMESAPKGMAIGLFIGRIPSQRCPTHANLSHNRLGECSLS